MNVKRNLFTSVLLSTLIGVGAGAASAADDSALVKQGFYGSQFNGKPDTTVKISGTTRYVGVDHYATVKIDNDKGQSFVWYFDPPMSTSYFPLKLIAPSGFDAGNTQVTILHPGNHMAP